MENIVKKINMQPIMEKVIIQEFLMGKKLFEDSNISYPNPPDCILEVCDGKRLWIEESCVYRKFKRIIAINNYEYECSENFNGYQLEMIEKINGAISNKNGKKNYKEFLEKYGSGILLLRIDDPCFRWQRDFNKIINKDNYKTVDLGFFNAVYLYNESSYVQKKSTDPVAWESKVWPGIKKFFLLCGQDVFL